MRKYVVLALFVALVMPSLALGQAGEDENLYYGNNNYPVQQEGQGGEVSDFASLISRLTYYLGLLVPALFGIALVLFIWSLVLYLTKAGENQAEIRQTILWGVITLAVMSGVWGLVKIVQNSVFGSGADFKAPIDTPQIQ